MKQSSWPGWETSRLIGRGSYGEVYEIQRQIFDDTEKAALKVISIPHNPGDIDEMYNDGYGADDITETLQSHLKSIVAEYSLMRKLNGNANIVHCEDVRYIQHEDGIGWDIFIKMELLTPLPKALGNSVDDEMVIKVARDMCAALEVCREHNVVHRDIKPQNIFISNKGEYKLGDFGIAKTVEKTMGGTKIGTYKYMAPEVYNNQPYGTGADIYSLGLVLYWLLNECRMPFMPLPPTKLTASLEEESRQRRLTGENLPVPHNGSEELKRIVLKACAFEPTDRYASAREMLDALNSLEATLEKSVPTQVETVIPVQTEIEDDRTVGLFITPKSEPKQERKIEQKYERKPTPKPDVKLEPASENEDTKEEAKQENAKENWAKGLMGGLLGAILGGLCIGVLSNYGPLAILGGLVVGVCTLGGYAVLAKGMSKKGLVICIILMALSIVISNFFSMRILFERDGWWVYEDLSVLDLHIIILKNMINGYDDYCDFYMLHLLNLGGCFLLAAVASYGMVRIIRKKHVGPLVSVRTKKQDDCAAGLFCNPKHESQQMPKPKHKAKLVHTVLGKKKLVLFCVAVLLLLLIIVYSVYSFVHIWTDATCYVPQTCRICGETKGSKLGHNWERYDDVIYCARCGAIDGSDCDKYGHLWGANDVCRICGEVKQ